MHTLRDRAPETLLAPLALLAVLAAGCSDNGSPGGDLPLIPPANEYGEGRHISSKLGGFFGPATWIVPTNLNSIGCAYPINANVATTGVTVTAVDTFDETGDGAIGSVYVQDTVPNPPLYAGISLYSPSYSPPDLRVFPGNVLDVVGPYQEYGGPTSGPFPECQTLSQLGGAATFRFDGAVPAAVEITPDDLNSYDNARQFLGMLVKVTNVSIASAPTMSSGRYSASVVVDSGGNFAISNELFDVPGGITLSQGQAFKSVTGIVTYFYSFQLAPRSIADFEM
jgi:hypothetical protein